MELHSDTFNPEDFPAGLTLTPAAAAHIRELAEKAAGHVGRAVKRKTDGMCRIWLCSGWFGSRIKTIWF